MRFKTNLTASLRSSPERRCLAQGAQKAARGGSRAKGGKLDFRKAAGLGADVWRGVDVDAYLDAERNQWK